MLVVYWVRVGRWDVGGLLGEGRMMGCWWLKKKK